MHNIRHQVEFGADSIRCITGGRRSIDVVLQLQVFHRERDESRILLNKEVVELESFIVEDQIARQRMLQPEPPQQPTAQLLRCLAVEFLQQREQ